MVFKIIHARFPSLPFLFMAYLKYYAPFPEGLDCWERSIVPLSDVPELSDCSRYFRTTRSLESLINSDRKCLLAHLAFARKISLVWLASGRRRISLIDHSSAPWRPTAPSIPVLGSSRVFHNPPGRAYRPSWRLLFSPGNTGQHLETRATPGRRFQNPRERAYVPPERLLINSEIKSARSPCMYIALRRRLHSRLKDTEQEDVVFRIFL